MTQASTPTPPVPVDLVELERLARAATPGPWKRDENNVWGACDVEDTTSYGMGINILACRSSVPKWAREPLDYEKSEANAAFIAAANPATVLALTARIATLEGALERIENMTNAEDPESYRADDREGCLDTVHAVAHDARKGGG